MSTSWPVVALDELKAPIPRAITDGPFGSNLTSAHCTNDGPQVVRLQNIGDGIHNHSPAHISQDHFENLRNHEVLSGDLLVASPGEKLPRACRVPSSTGLAIVKTDCTRIRLSDRVDPRWVMYSMQRPDRRRWAEEHLHGIGRPRLGLKLVKQIPVPRPPIEEQCRIVEFLEEHLSRLYSGEDYLAGQSARLDVIRLSLLQGYRTSIVAKGAPLLPIGNLAETALGKMLESRNSTGIPTPYLRNINVRWGRIDMLDIRMLQLTDEERTRLSLRKGDLLVREGGEPGRCAIWQGHDSLIAYQEALYRIRTKSEILDPMFLGMMLEYTIRSGQTNHLFTGTTIKHLPQETLRRIEIPVPTLEARQQALSTLGQFDNSIARLRSEISTAQHRAKALRRSLLAAAFAGKLTGKASDMDCVEEMAGV